MGWLVNRATMRNILKTLDPRRCRTSFNIQLKEENTYISLKDQTTFGTLMDMTNWNHSVFAFTG